MMMQCSKSSCTVPVSISLTEIFTLKPFTSAGFTTSDRDMGPLPSLTTMEVEEEKLTAWNEGIHKEDA